MALDSSSKSRKRHRRSSSCGQRKTIRGKIFFCKEYYIWYCTHNIFNFNKYFVRIIFLFVLLILQDHLQNLCVQISGMPSGTSLPLISFIRRLITTTLVVSKRTRVVHVNKGNDKIVIVQSTHNTATGPMNRRKAKSTSSLSTKQTSESACLLKLVRTCDKHQPFITLASLGAKSHSPRSRGKLSSTLKDFGG